MAIFSRNDSYIGLDVGTSSIKLVELKKEGRDALRLVTYASASGANSLMQGEGNEAIARTATIVREMMRKSSATATNAVVALPSLSVFSTVVSLPEMNEKDMEQAINYSAKNYVPSPLEEVVLGWTPIVEKKVTLKVREEDEEKPQNPDKEVEKKEEDKKDVERLTERKNMDVFLTAAPKDLVGRYSAVVDRLGLKLVAMEIESFPLSRSLLKDTSEPVLMVDIGDLATGFSVVENGYLRINQSVDMGGKNITEAIVARLGISYEEAEKRKQETGLLPVNGDDSLRVAMGPILRDIIDKSSNLRYLFERKRKKKISKVVLIGGGANLKGLSEFWTEVFGVAAEVGNPWKGIRVPAVLNERLRILGPSFAVAVGLALREFEQSE